MSAGNHAQGVAYHARRLGIPTTIVMPVNTPTVKVMNTRRHDAEVILTGETVEEAALLAREHGAKQGLTFVHPYDDPLVIAGQGTLALEMLGTAPEIEHAVSLLINIEKTVVEGAGAAGLAAALKLRGELAGRCIGLVLCGGNIDTRLLASVLTRELAREGRLTQLTIDLADRPGTLA